MKGVTTKSHLRAFKWAAISHSKPHSPPPLQLQLQLHLQLQLQQAQLNNIHISHSFGNKSRTITTKMAKTISPFQIPSLDFEYDKGRLTTRSDPKYPPSAEINRRISLWKGDITKLQSDAIVNAANEYMRGGGGIDGAIHKAAGPDLLRELIAIAPEGCDTGKSIISQGHGLPARFIIHTVGPRPNSHGGDSEKLLRSCYETILQVAEANQVRSLALCGISTGIFGYPAGDAAHVACDVVRKFFEGKERKNVDKVVFVVYNDKDTNAYKQVVPQYFPRAT